MQKIKILLDYQCYPMWVYDENGELIDNNLAEELRNEIEIVTLLSEIQNIYDGLFEDNAVNFEYKGFKQQSEKNEFLQKIEKVISLIKDKVGDSYLIENKVNI